MVVLDVIASAANNIIDVGMLGLGKKILARDLTALWSWRQYSRGFLFWRSLSCKGIRAKKSNPERTQLSTITGRGVCKGVHRCLTTNKSTDILSKLEYQRPLI